MTIVDWANFFSAEVGAGGFYFTAAGILIALAAGVWSSWVLLIEIMR